VVIHPDEKNVAKLLRYPLVRREIVPIEWHRGDLIKLQCVTHLLKDREV